MDINISRRVFIVCWITYTCVYICRVNISVALPFIEKGYESGIEMLGLIGSVFFVVYASGQLINGFLGDRFPPKRFVAVALLGTALMNFAIGVSNSLPLIIVCWGLNGYFQSMIWGPLMRILSNLFSKSRLRKVSIGMSCTMVLGYMIAWTVLGRVAQFMSWKWLFIIPFIVGTVILFIWLLCIRSSQYHQKIPTNRKSVRESLLFIKNRKLQLVVLACFFLGMVKEGILLWTPILFTQAIGFDATSSLSIIMIIPAANLIGIFFAGWLSKRFYSNVLHSVLIMATIALFCSLLLRLSPGDSKIVMAVLISIISAMSYGCNTIILSLIPLLHSKENMVSTLVGIFDFSSYIGAAASSFLTGVTVSLFGWNSVPVIWLIAGSAALVILGVKVVLEARNKEGIAT